MFTILGRQLNVSKIVIFVLVAVVALGVLATTGLLPFRHWRNTQVGPFESRIEVIEREDGTQILTVNPLRFGQTTVIEGEKAKVISDFSGTLPENLGGQWGEGGCFLLVIRGPTRGKLVLELGEEALWGDLDDLIFHPAVKGWLHGLQERNETCSRGVDFWTYSFGPF